VATIKSFEDIEAWRKARQFCDDVYKLTLTGNFAKDFSLRDQINRSAGSIMDNIAEGFERGSKNEFVQFLSYSKGSAGETSSQLFRALDRNHITEPVFQKLTEDAIEIGKMIGGFISYLNTSEIKGTKFKNRV
jgi:four helix bundle protein